MSMWRLVTVWWRPSKLLGDWSLKSVEMLIMNIRSRSISTSLKKVFHTRVFPTDYVYLYYIVLSKIAVKLPFTIFECDVLRRLNVGTSQLHPNSWIFIRAFDLVCMYFGVKATSIVFFFCFFKLKMGIPVKWC